MKGSPNDRNPPGALEAQGKKRLVNPSLSDGGQNQQQGPENSANISRHFARKKPAKPADKEDNDRGNFPTVIPRITQPDNSPQKNQG
jgi:hypothetical protein